MGQKWSKAQHKKYSATMKRKRNGVEASWTTGSENMITLSAVASNTEATNKPLPSETLQEKWNREANERFAMLPLFVKATLLDGR
jgi:hypothetical protein